MEQQVQMNCRLCDKDITGKEGLLLFDFNENVETKLGRKINIILNSTSINENLSNYCCSFCSSKVEICFSLLVEIQASDEVIRQAYSNLSNGKKIDTSTQLFICGECKTTITGIKLFTKHYESHILKKSIIGSKKNVAVSPNDCYSSEEDVEMNYNGQFTREREKNELYIGKSKEKTASDVAYVKLNVSLDENNYIIYNEGSDGNHNVCDDDDNSLYDLSVLSPDEINNLGDYTDTNDSADVNFLKKDKTNNILKDESRDSMLNSDDSDFKSENSFTSDSSYKNLVEIVKKELEVSDREDEPFDVSPNEDGNFSCETCKLSFAYKFILKLHLQKNHKAFHDLDVSNTEQLTNNLEADDDSDLIKCSYCKKFFSSSQFKTHVLECREDYSQNKNILCQICGEMCSYGFLEKHMEEHKKLEGWTCDLCGKKFKTKRFLKSHLGEHDESKKKICEFCGQKVLPLSFFSHIMKHREKRHVCQYCGKAFTYNYGLRIHLKVHESKKIEPKIEKKKDRVFCWLCKKDFDCTAALNKHLKNDHHTAGVEQDSRFSCSQCDKKFADMFSLKAHLKLIHEMKDEEIARLKSLPVYRYIECNVCNKVFNSENKIRIHMKQDHGLKPFEMEILKKECEKCGKKFASKQNLIHHINGAHLHIKPMTCDVCHEKFAKHSSLIYHKLRHSGEKPFQCEFCQKSYRQRNDVIRHLARHVRDKELSLEEASAVNNSPSRLVIKRRIFLKDSSINYQTIVRKSRRKSEVVEMEPILEEEINEIQEEQMEFNEDEISESMIYVEEVPVDENQPESPSDVHYIDSKPIYNEERNTIILSSPDVLKNSAKNITYRYIPSQLKHMPAVIVKKQEQI